MTIRKRTTIVVELDEAEVIDAIAMKLNLGSTAVRDGALEGDHTLLRLTYSYEEEE